MSRLSTTQPGESLSAFDPERALDAFEEAWQRGSSPDLAAFLPPPGEETDQDARRALLEELVAIDLEYRWRRPVPGGQPAADATGGRLPLRPRLEHYLARLPELARGGPPPPALIGEEYRVRRLWGDGPGPAEYQARFGRDVPGLEDLLARVDAEIAAEWPDAPSPSDDPMPAAEADPGPEPAEPLPSVAGYQVLGLIGRGGMGVVYKARHLRLRRLVALKMIRSGPLAGVRERARFRAEAEAAARLHHPNIVQIYDVGQQDGRPFVALEYVAGGTLADRLAAGPLPAARAAALVEALARAVAAAHRGGVLHRDLNPTNILLAPDPDDPGLGTPKVADFGLAKRLGEADEGPARTRTGAVIGTPSYMAPEQANGRPRDVGPAADVYALGAILYECLTGRPPFRAPSVLETLEQVRTRPPVPPSQLQPGVPRDLETIGLKCLEKDPHRRYPSAQDLAEDLRRFGDGLPIRARPVPAGRRFALWVRRRPALAALVALCTLTSLALVGGGIAYALALRAANARAEAHFRRAFEAVDRMLTRVGDEELAEVPEMTPVRRDLLADALAFLQSLVADERHGSDPALRRELARAHQRLGLILGTLGRPDRAEEHLRRAVALQERLVAASPGRAEARMDLASSRHDLGLCLNGQYRRAEAEAELRAARDLWEPLAASDPLARRKLALCYNSLSGLAYDLRRIPAAERAALRAIEVLDAAHAADPEAEAERARYLYNLGLLYYGTGRSGRAEALFRRCLSAWEPQARDGRGSSQRRAQLAECYHSLGYICIGDRAGQAEGLFQKELALRESLARQFPHAPGVQDNLARALHGLGVLYYHLGRRAEAAAAYERAVAIREALVRDHPRLTHRRRLLAETYQNLAMVSRGRQGLARFERAAAIVESLRAEHPGEPGLDGLLAAILTNVGQTLSEDGRPREGLQRLDRAVALAAGAARAAPGRTTETSYLRNAHGARAQVRQGQGLYAEAVADWGRVIELSPPADRPGFALIRCVARVRAGQCRAAVEEAAALVARPDAPGDLLYNAACVHALAAGAVADARLSRSYAGGAMDLLERARRSGFFRSAANAALLGQDRDLDALRGRDDFRDLAMDAAFPADPFVPLAGSGRGDPSALARGEHRP
jgi:eukaryotic-like serine/threonine-protein kinase